MKVCKEQATNVDREQQGFSVGMPFSTTQDNMLQAH
jgi:hypothetical protein